MPRLVQAKRDAKELDSTVHLLKSVRLSGPPPVRQRRAVEQAVDTSYNLVLSCGNMTQIFTRERFEDFQKEVQRLLEWGNALEDIQVGLLETDDPL